VLKLRLTGLYALRRLAAARATKKPSRGSAPLWVFSPPHFLCAGIASQFLYRAQKTSHTAGTLGEIVPKLVVNITRQITIFHIVFYRNNFLREIH
jgi:hypothetical protein